MKILPAILYAVSAEEKTVPPRHPLDRLRTLTRFSAEIMNNSYSWLPSREAWIQRFARNAARMERNFGRCGTYDPNLPNGGPTANRKRRFAEDTDRYNRDDPSDAIRQITTGFRRWAERYLSECSGQRNNQHQVNRMNRFNNVLQERLAEYLATTTTSTTTTTTSTTTPAPQDQC